jgi:hypothetical protein
MEVDAAGWPAGGSLVQAGDAHLTSAWSRRGCAAVVDMAIAGYVERWGVGTGSPAARLMRRRWARVK